MRALIVRHYKTRFNESGRIMGWFDSPRGSDWKADFDFVSTRLGESTLNIDRIISSDLERSRRTAELYARRLGITETDASPELNEINYGKLQKMKKRWVPHYHPAHKKDADRPYPGGESFRQVQARSAAFLTSLARSNPDQTLLLVTHAGVIRGLVSHCLGLELGDHLERRISFRYIGDFHFEGERCVSYDERGEPSGYVVEDVVSLPYKSTATVNS